MPAGVSNRMCQCLFTGVSAGSGKQLEERAVTEEIEIFSIRMRWFIESLAGSSRAGPTIVKPGQSLFIQTRRTLATQPGFSDARLRSPERYKQNGWKHQPPHRQVRRDDKPQQHESDRERHQPYDTKLAKTLELLG